jgi:hypothetical protein
MDNRRALIVALGVLLSIGCNPGRDENASAAAGIAANEHGAALLRQRREFRELALTVLRSLDHPCRPSLRRDRFHSRAAVREQLGELRQRLAGVYAHEFAIAEAQAQAEHSSVVYECVAPDLPGTAERIHEADARDSAAIRRMDELASES